MACHVALTGTLTESGAERQAVSFSDFNVIHFFDIYPLNYPENHEKFQKIQENSKKNQI